MSLKKLVVTLLAILCIPAAALAVPKVEQGCEPVPGKVTLIQAGYEKCGFCTVMESSIEMLAERFKDKLAVRYVDVLRNVEFREKYKIDAAPAQLIFDANGKLVTLHIGFSTRSELLEMLKQSGVQ